MACSNPFPKVSFPLQDPPEKNWYMINVQRFQSNQDLSGAFLWSEIHTHVFDDADKNGEVIEDNFVALLDEDFIAGDTVIVPLSNINESYYDFLKERDNSLFAFDLVSEPFNFPSNVGRGYGFFNLHKPDIRIVILEPNQ
ncbi:DUF4249 family protein [Fulvivirgaceae bacterium BMA10]|uniref:DUF4249 family protein n=1 Tax=Splendidivirga corallicola TaxID=3051826 RepID=A0ABT8KWV2_9BACT|nr:DUF4249 family protein [Fulvivirgaceae bacterium BMA10]